ncbi:hypothetical protein BDW22DRAFT_1486977, partial [Trametopsis cervina]
MSMQQQQLQRMLKDIDESKYILKKIEWRERECREALARWNEERMMLQQQEELWMWRAEAVWWGRPVGRDVTGLTEEQFKLIQPKITALYCIIQSWKVRHAQELECLAFERKYLQELEDR